MANDVFLSYARADMARAIVIKEALETLDLTVFFDMVSIDGGDVFPEVLEQEIRTAGAVIGVWNTYALSRDWVRRECEIARECKTLIPVEIGDISDVVMTVALSKLHRINLQDFTGGADHPGWQNTVRALARMLKRPDLIKTHKNRAKDEARAVKLESQLKTQRAAHAKLKASKGGIRPWQWATGLVVALGMAAGAGGYALNWQETQTRNRLIPPDVREKLATFDEKAEDAKAQLQTILKDVSVPRLIEAGSVDGQAALLAGWAYYFGEGGITQNDEEAIRFYRKSCNLGTPRGCFNLGLQYANGEGVEEDDIEANRLFKLACDGGSKRGCTNLGVQYDKGYGVEEDNIEANRLYKLACDGGDMFGCGNLGVQYDNGEGVEEDDTEASRLYKLACDGGHMNGCNNLGVQYVNGAGVPRDESIALTLFEQACAGSFQPACDNAIITRFSLPPTPP